MATYKHRDQTGSAGLTQIQSAMAAFENPLGPVSVLVCVIFQLLAWFVSLVQAVQRRTLAFLASLESDRLQMTSSL